MCLNSVTAHDCNLKRFLTKPFQILKLFSFLHLALNQFFNPISENQAVNKLKLPQNL